ncbi:MAG: hypothetical protein WCC10_06770, partial [Tumebacillaceae bacterium]
VKVVRANRQLYDQYRPRASTCKMVLFVADEQPEPIKFDIINGWTSLANAGIEVYHVSGTHHSMMESSNVEVLAEQLRVMLGNKIQ